MQKHIAICAALVAFGASGIGTAQAQYAGVPPQGYYSPGLRPFQVMQIVRSRGLIPLSRPMRQGPTYVVLAQDRSGGQVRLVLDAGHGDILGINPMMTPRPVVAGAAPDYGRPPVPISASPQVDAARAGYAPGAYPPSPPRAIPGTRIATAPAVLTATPQATARTPLPRPRPSVAAVDTPAPGASAPAAQPPEPGKPAEEAKPDLQLVPVAPLE